MALTSAERNRRHEDKGRDLKRVLSEEEKLAFDKLGLPKVRNPKRKAACRLSLALFAKTYFHESYFLPISPGQSADFETMQRVCTDGGAYALAAPRSDGKTTRSETATTWAMLYGYRSCIPIVGADRGAANEILDSIKLELRTNELLREDFPIPCWVACLSEDIALKAKSWTWGGVKLGAEWSKGRVVLPQLEGADGSGVVLVARGITGRIRGMRIKIGQRPVRPDLFVIDDPQTDESANSKPQCDTREKTILGAIMGSKGAKATISAVMPCTIIAPNDLASRFLDRKLHPDWHGSTRSLVTKWPTEHEGKWAEYRSMRKNESQEQATEFYLANREAMDAGGVMDWPERYDANEHSAIQSAENLLCDRGESVFMAEYQNTPIKEGARAMYSLYPQLIIRRTVPEMPPFAVPEWAQTVIAVTDINPSYGYTSAIVAFGNDQRAHVVWYGRETSAVYLSIREDPPAVVRARVSEGLATVGKALAGCGAMPRSWIIDGGGTPQDTVIGFCASSRALCGLDAYTAFGRAAKEYKPFGRHKIIVREQCHLVSENMQRRWVLWNADYWREIAQRGWTASPSMPGSCSIYAGHHTDFADQVCREQLVGKADMGAGTRWEWATQPGQHDYGDVMAMAYMGAAFSGIGTGGQVEAKPKAKANIPMMRPSGRK